jgi:FkbM family methyltransferase
MLIPFTTIVNDYKLDRNKYILHIGADECQERDEYNKNGFPNKNIFWIEGNSKTVDRIKISNSNINIYDGLVSDKDNDEVEFIITNNNQSSSILELEEHLNAHPGIYETDRYKKKTITVDTLMNTLGIDMGLIEFINIDIQGAELLALKGMKKVLRFAKYLYLEVNIRHLYKNCALITEIDSFLTEYGFERKETDITPWGWGDAIYVKKNLPQLPPGWDPKENGELLFFESIKNSSSLVFDVGSRFDSEFTHFKGDVHYFEPNSDFFEKLKTISTKNKNSYFNNFGLSNTNDVLWYYPTYQSFYNRITSCHRDDDSNKIKLVVKKATDYIKENNITSIDFVKIDTEGSELNVIKGFEDSLKLVKILQFEYGGTFLDNKTKLYDVIKYLEENGFENFNYILQYGLCPIYSYRDHYKYCNIVCFKKE